MRAHRLAKVLCGGLAEIGDFRVGRPDGGGVARVVVIGRADEREIVLVGNGEKDSLVGKLEEIAAVVIVEFRHDDVRSLDETHARARVGPCYRPEGLRDPGPGGVGDGARADDPALAAARIFEFGAPSGPLGLRRDEARAHENVGAARLRVAGVENDEPGVLHPAIGIFEREAGAGAQRRAGGIFVETQRPGRRQLLAAADVVVEKQARAQNPGGP